MWKKLIRGAGVLVMLSVLGNASPNQPRIGDIHKGSVSEIVSEGQHGSLPRKTWRRKEGRPPCGTKPARKS